MSRALVGEREQWGDPSYRVYLPPRDDPGFDAAAAAALLEAAREGQTGAAEEATGRPTPRTAHCQLPTAPRH